MYLESICQSTLATPDLFKVASNSVRIGITQELVINTINTAYKHRDNATKGTRLVLGVVSFIVLFVCKLYLASLRSLITTRCYRLTQAECSGAVHYGDTFPKQKNIIYTSDEVVSSHAIIYESVQEICLKYIERVFKRKKKTKQKSCKKLFV